MTTKGDPAPLTRLRTMPGWLIGQAGAYHHRLLAEGFAAVDARGYHYRLLAALTEHGPASQAELARRTGIDRSDVVAALNELEPQSLIARTPDPADRRRNVVTLTPEGAARLAALGAVLTGIQDDLCAPLTFEEREELVRLLRLVVEREEKA
ncbi:MarR family transcriptional regulator [Streptomyces sp. NPDC006798]|uniref:MarR family winged helix-turn-helix transcriptional regulator n=1 Tax=Streptomyces sp. NPDC006798 TaxID=3155462 RepID=UPI0033EC0C99